MTLKGTDKSTMMYQMKILILFLFLMPSAIEANYFSCIECAAMDVNNGLSGGMHYNQLLDDAGNIKDDPHSISMIASTIELTFSPKFQISSKLREDSLRMQLKDYKLDQAQNYGLREKVLAKVALNLAQRSRSSSGFNEGKFVSTESLGIFEDLLQ